MSMRGWFEDLGGEMVFVGCEGSVADSRCNLRALIRSSFITLHCFIIDNHHL
jgi:hypothetical protein